MELETFLVSLYVLVHDWQQAFALRLGANLVVMPGTHSGTWARRSTRRFSLHGCPPAPWKGLPDASLLAPHQREEERPEHQQDRPREVPREREIVPVEPPYERATADHHADRSDPRCPGNGCGLVGRGFRSAT